MTKEELENLKIQSEIDKNKAEEEKAKKEAVEVGKRTKFRWANYIIAGVIGAAAIYSWVHSTFSDLAKERNELANVRHERLQIRSDSLLSVSKELAIQKDDLNNQVRAITARLDSTEKQQQNELRLVTARLKEEKSKDQSNREEIKRLTAQVSNLNEDIKNTKSEKEQIRTIVPAYVSSGFANRMIIANNYYDRFRNPNGVGIENKFELQPGDSVVYDAKTGWTWQQSGSSNRLVFDDVEEYIRQINRDEYGGFTDWRPPTLKEAMSLMSPDKKDDFYIDPLFDQTQWFIWTSDRVDASTAWVVFFGSGGCDVHPFGVDGFVRAVRSGQSVI